MRAVRAGPVLSGQHFSNEQILRAALSGPVNYLISICVISKAACVFAAIVS